MSEDRRKRMANIASQGTLDLAYPPFILASTAAAMDMEVAVFFTFGVRMIACQMTMDIFGFTLDDFIEGVDVAGAAAFLEFAADADIQLFI